MKRTALLRASLEGHAEVVLKLLKHGADINFKDQVRLRRSASGRREGGEEIARDYLYTLKPQPNAGLESGLFIGASGSRLPCVFQLGSRAIHWACRGGSLEVIKALRSHGADLNVRDKVTHVRNRYLWEHKCRCFARDSVVDGTDYDPVTASAGVHRCSCAARLCTWPPGPATSTSWSTCCPVASRSTPKTG